MNQGLLDDYIHLRMTELGHEGKYHVRIRHFVLSPLETRKTEAQLQLYILCEPRENIRIESAMGIFDLAETATNELQFEHQGTITLTNYSPVIQHFTMIQVIFKTN